ncbi:hypothetical protein M422DRAFT_49040 [Sphaerobolus stellatus SS14]|uniref:Uncharacterized protein n=1 Tax=Sphaerobolus stellatus (strain SS14) TaxID=990650 RepID=A0A0C9VGV5_SPHS4|nr:hypothetical protein M422DRAFT_49040 [Sphaerobolus stellatus SS14]
MAEVDPDSFSVIQLETIAFACTLVMSGGKTDAKTKRKEFCAVDYAGVYEHFVRALKEFKVREPKLFGDLQYDLASRFCKHKDEPAPSASAPVYGILRGLPRGAIDLNMQKQNLITQVAVQVSANASATAAHAQATATVNATSPPGVTQQSSYVNVVWFIFI